MSEQVFTERLEVCMIFFISFMVFIAGYLLNIFYITVLYHRGLTHSSVQLNPFMTKWVAKTGNWVTGLDPKAWACMHRLHHQHSDTEEDPHSPLHQGVMGIWIGQLKSYQKILTKLILKDKKMCALVQDIPFEVNILNRKKLWFLPYLLHTAIAFGLGYLFHSKLLGFAYYAGIMSHPIQGWMVNALAHNYGYRNFDSADNSRNNTLISILVFGEGLQNNHHHFPKRAKFSVKKKEWDPGFALCLMASKLKLIKIVS